jgi:CubicO group peptidase (beta-lactamase class C family)
MSTIDEALVRELFHSAVTRSGAYGAQLSIVKRGEQLDLALGLADARQTTPMTTDTLMQIGSITKVFNAVVVMTLVDEGVLTLDAPIERHLAGVPIGQPNAIGELTLRHLLSMSSGLDNGPYVYYGRGADALDRYVGGLASLPRHFAPGRHFGYSNAGACIAGCIASIAAGAPWERLLRERILTPARLQRGAILDEDVRGQVVSVGHVGSATEGLQRTIEPLFSELRARAPSGPSFALSTSDLVRFASLFTRRGITDTGVRVLSETAVEQMLSPQIATPNRKYGTAWCLGSCAGAWDDQHVWGHGGTSPTATSYLYWIPEQGGVIAFVTNTHAAMGELSTDVFDQICSAVFGCRKPRIDVAESGSASVDQRRYIGRYRELGMTMDVRPGEDDTLLAHLAPRPIPGERGITRTEQRVVLKPVGKDRFITEPMDGPDRHRGVIDTAFFGDDGDGRARNALNLVFPMSRVAA